ncbi:MAG: sulfurtransferase [Halanaerobiales bacterium]|nr:sulfurtransferase [Halanaerobiales bacterium]
MLKSRKLNIIVLSMLVFVLCFSFSLLAAEHVVPIEERGYANPDALISCEDLNTMLEDENVVVVDNRGKVKYHTGHIPGAVNIEKGEMKADGGMRLTKSDFEALFSKYGIENDDTVVVYDDHGDLYSAWLWWMAKLYGHEDIRMLDGSINRWKELNYDTKLFGSSVEASEYKAEEADLSLLATKEDVQEAIENEDTIILDSRAKGEFDGEELLSGAARKGRIPSSVWLEWSEVLNSDDTFMTAQKIKEMYDEKGISSDNTVYPYCQSAVRSSHATFVMTQLLGYENVANYDGSWIEWSNDESLPIE